MDLHNGYSRITRSEIGTLGTTNLLFLQIHKIQGLSKMQLHVHGNMRYLKQFPESYGFPNLFYPSFTYGFFLFPFFFFGLGIVVLLMVKASILCFLLWQQNKLECLFLHLCFVDEIPLHDLQAFHIKNNISQFSGFVWHNNEVRSPYRGRDIFSFQF